MRLNRNGGKSWQLTAALVVLGVFTMTGPLAAKEKASDLPETELPRVHQLLTEGGNLVIFRHTQKLDVGKGGAAARHAFDAADAALADPIIVPEEHAHGGMCLTPLGKATAWLLGEVVRRGNIPVGKVLASATCRTRQHAKLMFGDNFEVEPALIFGGVTLKQFASATHAKKKRVFDEAIGKTNVFVIGHGKTAQEAGLVDFWPQQGDALVFRKNAQGVYKLEAHLTPRMFVRLLPQKADW
jgi:hypothetical protein